MGDFNNDEELAAAAAAFEDTESSSSSSSITNEDGQNVGIAFALVIGAGLSTALGASVVFFPSLVKLASRKTLAGALGLSAGVMMYISFVEIFQKSVQMFEEAEEDSSYAYLYATLCFFGGVGSMNLLGFVVHNLLHLHHGSHSSTSDHPVRQHQREQPTQPHATNESDCSSNVNDNSNNGNNTNQKDKIEEGEDVFTPPCCQTDPGAQLDTIQRMAADQEAKEEDDRREATVNNQDDNDDKDDDDFQDNDNNSNESSKQEEKKSDIDEKKKLVTMSLNTAIAIALHNFPEGLATFIAALHDPAVGSVLAVAIAIHNIPEGLCVAMPVYYGTGSKRKAFFWALFSGISEPLAAVFGYLVIRNAQFSPRLYGTMFGLVAGMMVMISIKELLPTAHRYDPNDTVVTNFCVLGMAVMAISLCLFMINA